MYLLQIMFPDGAGSVAVADEWPSALVRTAPDPGELSREANALMEQFLLERQRESELGEVCLLYFMSAGVQCCGVLPSALSVGPPAY